MESIVSGENINKKNFNQISQRKDDRKFHKILLMCKGVQRIFHQNMEEESNLVVWGFFVCVWYFQHSVQFSCSVVSDSLRPHELQHARPTCPSPIPRLHPNSCPSSGWCHPAISSSVIPFSSCPQCLPASESFPVSQLFTWGGQSIGVSALASVLPMNTQNWSPLGWI